MPRVRAIRSAHSGVSASREGKVCMASTTSRSSNSRQSGSNSGSVGYFPLEKHGRTAAALKPFLATRRSSAMESSTLWIGSIAQGNSRRRSTLA